MSFHIPCFQDRMSVSLEAGGTADNIHCFTFNSSGSLWLPKHSCFSKHCENSFHFRTWGGWWYQGSCMTSRKVEDKGHPGAVRAVLQLTLSWTALLRAVCPQCYLQLWNPELCLGCCELQRGRVTHGSLSGTQAVEELALSTPAWFCCESSAAQLQKTWDE